LPICLCFPARMRLIPSLVGLLLCLVMICCMTPWLVRRFAALCESLCHKYKKPYPSLLLASKNLRNRKSMAKVGRLMALVMAMLMAVMSFGAWLDRTLRLSEDVILSDFLVGNLPVSVEQALREDESVESISSMSLLRTVEVEGNAIFSAVMLGDGYESSMLPQASPARLPAKDEIVIHRGLARSLGVSVGDGLNINMAGVCYSLKVCEIQDINSFYVIVNDPDMPMELTLHGVKLKADNEDVRARVTAQIEEQGAVLLDREDVFGSLPYTVDGFRLLLRDASVMAVLISVLGCVNALAEIYRGRRQEREQLRHMGMSKSARGRMYACELCLLLGSALILALIFGAFLFLWLHFSMESFGFCIFV